MSYIRCTSLAEPSKQQNLLLHNTTKAIRDGMLDGPCRGLAGAVAWWDGEGRLTYPPAACHQLGAAHAYGSSSSSFPAASSSAQAPHGGDLLRQLRVYQRLLLLEEAAMEDHIRRCGCMSSSVHNSEAHMRPIVDGDVNHYSD